MAEPVVTTPRLLLRDWTPDDLLPLWELLREPGVAREMSRIPPCCSREYAGRHLARTCEAAQNGWGRELAVVDRASGRLLGSCGFADLFPRHRRGELAYFFRADARGQGYAREAVAALRDWGVRALDLQRLSARCFAGNLASRRLLEALGFSLEGVARRELLREGVFEDVCQYAWLRAL